MYFGDNISSVFQHRVKLTLLICSFASSNDLQRLPRVPQQRLLVDSKDFAKFPNQLSAYKAHIHFRNPENMCKHPLQGFDINAQPHMSNKKIQR